MVDRAQRATALVDVNTSDGRAFGSAFYISNTGLFATDGHVVWDATGEIKLVIRPGEKDQRVVVAHVLGIDYDADLAVMQTDNPGDVPRLQFGNSDAVTATQEITAFGYPFGNMLAMEKDTYPSVTVNSGKVTALRKDKGELALIQVDALVNPGNSGGPVLDADGKVIGLVESGVPGAGLNFVTPVAKLKKMLDGPLVLIDPITVNYAQRTKPQTFSIHVSSPSHPATNYDVNLALTDPKGTVQAVSGKTAAGKCDLVVAPTMDNGPIKYNPFEDEPPGFKFVLTLKQSDRVVGTEHGTIYLTDIPLPGGGIVRNGPPHGGGKKAGPHPGGGSKDLPLNPLPADAMETPLFGAEKGNEFREVSSTHELAIGVQYAVGETNGKPTLTSIRLLYAKPAKDKDTSIVAKDGYVVGGLKVGIGHYSNGQFPNAFQVIFIREKDGKLDPSDSYPSDWTGTAPSASKQKQLAGNGERVIGICGRKGFAIRAIGLVIEKSPTATTQPAGK
jgi:hypothetical protein